MNHETETISGPSKEAGAFQGGRQAPEAVASQIAPAPVSGHEGKAFGRRVEQDDDKGENKAAIPANSGAGKKTRGPARISSKMRNSRTGSPFVWDTYSKDKNYASFMLPLPHPVLRAAHYIDRSISPQFTASVIKLLHQNWDDMLPMERQPWCLKLQGTEVPNMVEVEAARAVNGGELPDGIPKATKLTLQDQKWLAEQQPEPIAEKKRKAAATAERRASKKAKKTPPRLMMTRYSRGFNKRTRKRQIWALVREGGSTGVIGQERITFGRDTENLD